MARAQIIFNMANHGTYLFLFCFGGFLFGFSQNAGAQVELTRQVMGAGGASAMAGATVIWQYTLGEPVVATLSQGPYDLTQGFHQPGESGTLIFELEIGFASCPTSTDGFARITGIAGCEPPYTITWSNGVTGPVNERLSPGLQSVTVTSAACEAERSFEILAAPEGNCILRFFNAFSPNGDGVNDLWTIENINLPEFSNNEVHIFNRWGQEVWSGRNYDNVQVVWDGSGKQGDLLPPATYFYTAEVAGVLYKGYIEITP